MFELVTFLLPLAEGRSENPGEGGGVLIIVGSIIVAVLVVGGILMLVARKTRG